MALRRRQQRACPASGRDEGGILDDLQYTRFGRGARRRSGDCRAGVRRRTSSSRRRWFIVPAPTPRTAFHSPMAPPTTGRCSTSATAASTASRSSSRNARPGYATDKGVECYERLKGKGPTGAGYFSPLSTGITFALTEKVPGDKIPLLTTGLRPFGKPRRRGVHLELHRARQLLDGGRHRHPAHRQGTGRVRQTQGQEDQPRSITTAPMARSRSPALEASAQSATAFEFKADPRDASRRRAEIAMARHPPGPPRLRAAYGAGA